MLAPDKNLIDITTPMTYLRNEIIAKKGQGNSETKDRDAMQLKTLILSNTTNNILKQTTPQLSLFL
jgi:hypothetical protein